MARRTALLRQSGPYVVESYSLRGEVWLKVIPAYSQYGPDWQTTRAAGQGGGPGIFTAMQLAKELEAFLNQDTRTKGASLGA